MSFVWNERDDNAIEALKMLKEKKGSLMLPNTDKTMCLTFKIKDYYKANALLMDIMYENNLEEITGIHALEVSWGKPRGIEDALSYIEMARRALVGEG